MSLLRALLFYLVVLFLPTQLSLHFWPNFAYVSGIRVDYLAPTIYVTDILICLLFFTWLKNKKFIIYHLSFIIRSLAILVFIGSIGIIFSLSPIAGIYKLIKILEFVFFGFVVAENIRSKKDFSMLAAVLAAGIIFESGLAIWQFINQSSIGGVFWFLGERTFSGQTPGIANANIDGRLVLRPYGTFPHPNVLAGYLTIAMAIVISNFQFPISNFKKIIFVAAVLVGTAALFLTLSRVAIIVWLLVMGSWFIVCFRKKFIIYHLSFIIFLIIGSIYFSPLPSRFASIATVDRESFVFRRELNSAAVEMIKSSPVFGAGLNNFLIALPRYQKSQAGPLWLQPAHNIYLLILAETGISGFLLFIWFVVKTYVRIKDKGLRIKDKNFIIHHSSFIIFFMVLLLGFFDHYFLTLQQGQLLLALIFGLFWSPALKKF